MVLWTLYKDEELVLCIVPLSVGITDKELPLICTEEDTDILCWSDLTVLSTSDIEVIGKVVERSCDPVVDSIVTGSVRMSVTIVLVSVITEVSIDV